MDNLKFQSGTAVDGTVFQKITNSMEFYDAYLKKYIVELDKILREEYKALFIKEQTN